MAFDAINDLIHSNRRLSLTIWLSSLHYGVLNAREAFIEEPDPYEGRVANPEAGLDTQYCHGSRRPNPDLNIRARNTDESLELLDKKCQGENVEDTVSYSQSRAERQKTPTVHGDELAHPGIDSWIKNDFSFQIQYKKDGLFASLNSSVFEISGLPIANQKVSSVEEGIKVYQENVVSSEIVRYMQWGLQINKLLQDTGRLAWMKPDEGLDIQKGNFQPSFIEKYDCALQQLKKLPLTENAVSALLPAIILGQFYQLPNQTQFDYQL